jgi:hypothetical protein
LSVSFGFFNSVLIWQQLSAGFLIVDWRLGRSFIHGLATSYRLWR